MNSLKRFQNKLRKTSTDIRRAGIFFSVPVLLDAVFFIALGFIASGYQQKIFEYMSAAGLDSAKRGAWSPYVTVLNVVIASYALSLLLVYWAIQGSAWWWCRRFSGHKDGYSAHMGVFFRASIFWGVLYMVYVLVDYAVSLGETIAETDASMPLKTILVAYLAIVAYGVFMSHAGQGKTLKDTLKGIWRTGKKSILASVTIFLVLSALSVITANVPVIVGVLVQLGTVLPALSAGRMLLINSCKNQSM